MAASGLRLGLSLADLKGMGNTVLANLITEWNRPPGDGGAGGPRVREATQADINSILM